MTTSKSLLITLDPQQIAAAEAPEGPVLIIGGPGVGKTRTILARVEVLLKKGTPPQAITCVAHNNWCAENMRLQLLENTEIAHAASRVRFRTMEICALDVLRGGGLESLGLSPGFRVWGRRRKAAEIAKLVQEFPITPGISPGENEQILEWLGLLTARRNIEPGNVPDTWHWVLKKYVERKTDQQFLDLDDLIHLAILAMERDPEVRSWQETRSRHLLVDDFQDITPVQYGLLELMAGPSGSITFGADPNQCIEIRRGADPHLEESFRKDWPTLDIHHLRLNYRCTRALVRVANSWASHLHPEDLRTDLQEAARVEEGTTPTLIGLHGCPQAVGAQFLELAWQVRQHGFAWEDMAILCREPSDIDRIRGVLKQHSIPHEAPGDARRDPDFDALRVISLLALALNHEATEAFEIAVFPESDNRRQKINAQVAEAVIETARSQGIDVVEAAEQKAKQYQVGSPVHRDLIHITRATRNLDRMLDDPGVDLQEICQRAADLVRQAPAEGAEPRDEGDMAVLLRLSDTPRGTDQETPRQRLAWFLDRLNSDIYSTRLWLENRPRWGGVTLVTVQESKGLERKIVFFIDAADPIRPQHGIFSEEELRDGEDRALYVALTRACDQFYYLGSARRSEDIESVINPTGPAVPDLDPIEATLYSDWEEQNDDMMRQISIQAWSGDQLELAPAISHREPAEGGSPPPALRGRARDAHDDLCEFIVRRLEQRQPGDVPNKPKKVGGWEIIVVSLLTGMGLIALRWLGIL